VSVLRGIKRDIQAAQERDPAATSALEVILAYPGFHARQLHRLAHFLYQRRQRVPARVISHLSRTFTGIEIHPGAQIGKKFFIDHGMGVVIGETAEIGDNVTIYHGVTLGGVTWDKVKRHPTVEDNVVIGSGSKVLGPFTVGKGAKIGSNSVVVKEVPPNATVVGIPGRVVMQQDIKVVEEEQRPDLEHGKLPDPEAKAISCLFDQIRALEKKVAELSAHSGEKKAKPAVKKAVKRSTSTRKPAAKSGASVTNSRQKEKTEA